MTTFNLLLDGLKGISESTRLRIVCALLNGELTVSELTHVLNQSQPRVSRHLKLLSDAQIIERHQEGSWVFYRVADHPLVDFIRQFISREDRQLQQDLERLGALHAVHRERSARYFSSVAGQWDQIHAQGDRNHDIERHLLQLTGDRAFRRHVDLGTGTGRMLRLFAHRTRAALGIDNSREMLAVARSNLAGECYVHCQARYGDILNPDVDDASSDLVTVHHVLHYLDSPGAVIRQAARILEPAGVLLVVDYAPHSNERLREESVHRRLGFEAGEVADYLREAGLSVKRVEALDESSSKPAPGSDEPGVMIWVGSRDENVLPTPAFH